jgi:hypothetical protein
MGAANRARTRTGLQCRLAQCARVVASPLGSLVSARVRAEPRSCRTAACQPPAPGLLPARRYPVVCPERLRPHRGGASTRGLPLRATEVARSGVPRAQFRAVIAWAFTCSRFTRPPVLPARGPASRWRFPRGSLADRSPSAWPPSEPSTPGLFSTDESGSSPPLLPEAKRPRPSMGFCFPFEAPLRSRWPPVPGRSRDLPCSCCPSPSGLAWAIPSGLSGGELLRSAREPGPGGPDLELGLCRPPWGS